MATAPEFNILTHLECTICLETFDNPKELVCKHTFCKTCLDDITEFVDDGTAVIKCPNKCEEKTNLGKEGTTNDLYSNYYINSILDAIKANLKRSETLEHQYCVTDNCENNASWFCTICMHFMCTSCKTEHVKNESEHVVTRIIVDKDNRLKVVCSTHGTICEFMCCGSELICLYCKNRQHANHDDKYKRFEDEIQSINKMVHENIEKYTSYQKAAMMQFVPITHNVFDRLMTSRKQKRLLDYMSLLNTEEDALREEFHSLMSDYEKILAVNCHQLTALLQKTELEMLLMHENITKSLHELCSNNFMPSLSVSLSDSNYLSDHPLGKFIVEFGEVDVKDDDKLVSVVYDRAEIIDQTDLLIDEYRMFLQNGNHTHGDGDTPSACMRCLHIFGDEKGRNELMQECIQNLEEKGFPYLEELIRKNQQQKLNSLILSRPDILEMRDYDWCDKTLLHWAVTHDQLDIVKLLIAYGCNVNDVTSERETILHIAVLHDSRDCLAHLCKEYPSLLNLKDTWRRTALDLATARNNVESIRVLR